MSKFKMDEDATLDAMAHASTVDLFNGSVTLYGVACFGTDEEHTFSHGGQLSLDPREVIDTANEVNADNVTGCRYLAFAAGIRIEDLVKLWGDLKNSGMEYDGE